jgi:hypothetical protein
MSSGVPTPIRCRPIRGLLDHRQHHLLRLANSEPADVKPWKPMSTSFLVMRSRKCSLVGTAGRDGELDAANVIVEVESS